MDFSHKLKDVKVISMSTIQRICFRYPRKDALTTRTKILQEITNVYGLSNYSVFYPPKTKKGFVDLIIEINLG